MKTITYTGPLADGYIVEPDTGRQVQFTRGDAVQVSDAAADSLIASGQWAAAAE